MKNTITLLTISLLVFNSCQLFQPAKSANDRAYKEDSGEPVEKDNQNKNEEEVVKLPNKKNASLVNFVSSEKLDPLLKQSAKENKPVFVDFYATWCGPCKLMDKKVFTDAKFAAYLNDNFISYKVDADQWHGIQLTAEYDVKAIPTLLFLDSNGNVLSRKNGAAFQTELRGLGNQALEAFKDKNEN